MNGHLKAKSRALEIEVEQLRARNAKLERALDSAASFMARNAECIGIGPSPEAVKQRLIDGENPGVV
jgi:hypothetical protein